MLTHLYSKKGEAKEKKIQHKQKKQESLYREIAGNKIGALINGILPTFIEDIQK